MNKNLARAKKFVADHKVAIAVTIPTVACVFVHCVALQQHNDFLKEHNLFDEFYQPED